MATVIHALRVAAMHAVTELDRCDRNGDGHQHPSTTRPSHEHIMLIRRVGAYVVSAA